MPDKTDFVDELDFRILSKLVINADQPYTEIAKELFVSGGTIHVRIKKLKKMGIIKRSVLDIDYHKLGYDVTAFLGIYLEKSSLYDSVASILNTIPEIIDAHYTTGNYSIFAKIICRDTKHLKEILTERIQSIDGVQRTETFISLQESISRPLQIPGL
jgi:Lrp/AsnC family transcriptional regulator for asnA, asnC and gidA